VHQLAELKMIRDGLKARPGLVTQMGNQRACNKGRMQSVEILRKNLPPLWRRVRADGSYLSANDPRILVGLGNAPEIDRLVVHWPDGQNERFPVPPAGRYTTLVQGAGAKDAPK